MKYRILISMLLLIVMAVAIMAKDDESSADAVPAAHDVPVQPNYNL